MARVKATQYRVVIQYRDEAGHRLPSEKGGWKEILTTDILLLDCPKCPEPVKAKVECDHECHRWGNPNIAMDRGWRYCPRCGVALTAKA